MAANRHDLTDNLAQRAQTQLGTLGSGNDFLEVCLDEHHRGGFHFIPTHYRSPNNQLLLPSGINVLGIDVWVQKLADVA